MFLLFWAAGLSLLFVVLGVISDYIIEPLLAKRDKKHN